MKLSTTDAAVGGDDEVWPCVVGQRETTVTFARTLDETGLVEATRCAEWTVRDLLLHLCDTTVIFDRRLAGVDCHRFDPVNEPQRLIAAHGGEASAGIPDHLEDTSSGLVEKIASLLATGDTTQVEWLYPNPVDWRLLAIHCFWDEWVHERDLRLLREPHHRSTDNRTRLAAAYGLMLCGLGPLGMGIDMVYEATFNGVGGGSFRLRTTGGQLEVVASAVEDADGIDAATAVDSMAGRGPLPSEAFEGDSETLAALSIVGQFMRGDFATA